MKKPDWRIWMDDKQECKNWLDNYIRKEILRKSSDESRLHLKKTEHNLKFGNWIYEKHKDLIPEFFGKENFYDWVINIFYYAIYHSASALVSKKEYNSKSHLATLCFLIYHYYHTKKSLEKQDVEFIASSLNKEDIETIGISKELRERASYNVHESFEQRLAEQARKNTIELINKVRHILSE